MTSPSVPALPQFTIGSFAQIRYGLSVRARLLPVLTQQLDPALVAYAAQSTDATFWIAAGKKPDVGAWLTRMMASEVDD